MAVLMPISLPCASTRAPPELPGLTAASVWMKLSTGKTSRAVFGLSNWMSRALADTMPAVTVLVRSKGLPTASTQSPTRTSSLFPHDNASSPSASMRRTAMSVAGSLPINSAENDRLSLSPISMASAPSMTWWLVTMRPSEDRMTPLPDPRWTRGWAGGAKNPDHPPGAATVWAVRTCTTASKASSAASLNPTRGGTVASEWCAGEASVPCDEASRSRETTPWWTSAVQWACWIERLSCSVGAPGWNWRTMIPPRMAEKRERKIVLWTIQLLCVWGNNAS